MLLAARWGQTGEAAERTGREIAEACAAQGDWDAFLGLCIHHSLAPLVFAGLDRQRPAELPPRVLVTLGQWAKINAFKALRSMTETGRLLDALHTGGDRAAVLKGVPLSQMLYGSPHARQVGDLDLLLRADELAERLPRAAAQLASLGYRRENPAAVLTPRRLRSYVRFWKDATFRNEDEGFDLDLHWRLFNHRRSPGNAILAGARFVDMECFGSTVRVLSEEDQFLYVAAHGASDAWIYLKGLADLAAFLNLLSPGQFDAALERAHAIGLGPQISAGVHLSNSWMGTRVDSARLVPLTDPLVQHLLAAFGGTLRRHGYKPMRDDRTPAAWVGLERRLVPGGLALLEIGRRFLWRPRVWQRYDLPDRLFPLYPLLGLFLLPRTASWQRRRASRPSQIGDDQAGG